MVWLYYYMADYIGLDGAEFKRGDFDNSLAEIFSAETPCSLTEQESRSQMVPDRLSDDISDEVSPEPDKELVEG